MGGVICQASAVDQSTQSLSAFNVIDQIVLNIKPKDPTNTAMPTGKLPAPVQFQVISLWKRNHLGDMGKEVRASMEVEILDPQGESLQTIPFELVIPATIIRARYILNVNGMLMTTSGEYCFQFTEKAEGSEKSDPISSLCIDVIVNKI